MFSICPIQYPSPYSPNESFHLNLVSKIVNILFSKLISFLVKSPNASREYSSENKGSIIKQKCKIE